MLMKKITLFFMSLFFAMTAWAGVTDLPEMSTEGNIKWYTISNTRSTSGKYLYWAGNETGVKDSNTITAASLFYFTGTADACYIHNFATEMLMAGNDGWSTEGVVFNISETPHSSKAGVAIGFNDTFLNEQNHADGYTTWNADDAGSIFVIELVTDFSAAIDVPAAKEAAIAELNGLATASVIYPTATAEAVAAINAVTPADNSIAGLNAAIYAINATVAKYRTNAYKALAGKSFSINTPARANGGYITINTDNVKGIETLSSPAAIWQFVENNGSVNIYNPYTELYLCEPQNASVAVAVTAEQAKAGAYHLNVATEDSANDGAIIKLTSKGKSVHMAGGFTLVRWDDGDASEWNISLVDNNTISSVTSEFFSTAKTAAVEEVEAWAQITNLFPAKDEFVTRINDTAIESTTIAGCKEAVNAINAVIADYIKTVDGKSVRFTSYGRDNANGHDLVIEADGGYGKTKAGDAGIWTLKAADTQVKLYNFVADLWLGKTAGGSQRVPAVQTEAEAMTYKFNYNNTSEGSIFVNLINAGNTLHLDGGKKVVQWNDNNDASSQFLLNAEPSIVPARELYVAANNSAVKLPYEIQKAYGLVKDAANYDSNWKSEAEGSY